MRTIFRRTPPLRVPPSLGALVALLAAALAHATEHLPTVASINLCADQHVLGLADPEQVLTVSWLAADPEESLFAAEAQSHALNYGTAEEIIKFAPDIVLAGSYTSPFTRTMLKRLDFSVVELEPEASVADIERNVRLVAKLLGQTERGEALIAELRARVRSIEADRPAERVATVIVRPGGFTVGTGSLSNDLLALAGLRNVAAEQGLDRWGSLAMETLLRTAPDLIVLTGYRRAQPSLANAVLEHPALVRAAKHRSVIVPAALWACGVPGSVDSAALMQQAARR